MEPAMIQHYFIHGTHHGSRKPPAVFLAVIIALIFHCSTPQLAGSISETTNGAITGTVVYPTGGIAKGAQVKLIPADFDPYKDSLTPRIDTTDSNGRYVFTDVASGSYNVRFLNDNGRLRAFSSGVRVEQDTVTVPVDTLQQPGRIEVTLPDGVDFAEGYVYVPGTDIFVFTGSESGFVPLDSVPVGTMPSICYATKSGSIPTVVRYDVRVFPGQSDTIMNPAWKYARTFYLNTTASGAGVPGPVYGFPVLIRLTGSNFDFSQAQPDGGDLRFTKADNTFVPFEIERWDFAGAHAEIWVKIDTVFGNDSGRCLTMYWGAATDVPAPSEAVFDTNIARGGFQGVWHLSEPTNSMAFDATGNGYNGAPMGNPAPVSTTGIIGNAAMFNGTSGYFEMPNTANSKLNFPQHGTYTVSAWVKVASLSGAYQMIASKGDKQYNLEIKGGTNEWEFVEYQDTTGWDETTSKAFAQSWVYLAGVRSNQKEYLYVNGTCADSVIYNLPFSASDSTYGEIHGLRSTADNFMLGKMDDYPKFFFSGIIDEVRVSNTAQSADWIRLCYMNQKETDMLVRFK
jgi:Concanavalin A-like lectin/glucanases superfamily/Domain of unknown function (DUF2341)